jgi:hypothetical protein
MVDAFKEAKLEHNKRQQGSTEKQRLQAEVDADAATLSQRARNNDDPE